MTNPNNSKNSELQIIQEHLDHVSGNVLLCSDDSDLINSLSNKKIQILSNASHSLSIHIDNLLLTNTFHNELSKFDQKFNTVIIGNLLERINYPELFLRNLVSILDDEGVIICSTSNFFHITNIINLLIGNILHSESNSTRFHTLEKFLQFLNQNNLHVTKISRIKQEFSSQEMNLDDTLIPDELLNILEKISDSDTLKYIFMIGEGKTISTKNFEFVSEFPKNYLLPKLKEFFEKVSELEDKLEQQKTYTESLVKEIDSMTDGSSLSEKEKLIQGLIKSVEEQKAYTVRALSEKDEIIEGYEDSIKKQEKIIKGHEDSIKELKDYIVNLEKNVHDLESRLGKLAFWKKK